MGRRQFTHAGIGCLVCIGGILSFAPPSAADDGPASAVSQYVETIPTSGGSQAVGAGKASKSELSARAKAALGAVDPVVAKQLTVIVTSSSYGAPATPPDKAVSGDKGSSDTGSVAPQPTLTEASSVSTLGIVDANASLVIALSTILGITTVTMILVAALGKGRGQA